MSRQTERQNARANAKIALAVEKQKARRTAKRDLLVRQTTSEKSNLYSGPSVASLVSPSRSRILKRKVKKGNAFGRIITTFIEGDREISLHATKGWRSHAA